MGTGPGRRRHYTAKLGWNFVLADYTHRALLKYIRATLSLYRGNGCYWDCGSRFQGPSHQIRVPSRETVHQSYIEEATETSNRMPPIHRRGVPYAWTQFLKRNRKQKRNPRFYLSFSLQSFVNILILNCEEKDYYLSSHTYSKGFSHVRSDSR